MLVAQQGADRIRQIVAARRRGRAGRAPAPRAIGPVVAIRAVDRVAAVVARAGPPDRRRPVMPAGVSHKTSVPTKDAAATVAAHPCAVTRPGGSATRVNPTRAAQVRIVAVAGSRPTAAVLSVVVAASRPTAGPAIGIRVGSIVTAGPGHARRATQARA